MKIRMKVGISGPNITLSPKQETEAFTDDEALRLMLSDQAAPADEEAADALVAAIQAAPAEEPPAEDPPAEEPPAEEAPAEAPAEEAPKSTYRPQLDHDNNGENGGSPKGEQSTRSRGKAKAAAKPAA
ncbi:MAG TPA: hypothetical protein VNH53_03810 [Sphingomicrobium sp.]|jgi:hypothetical protein|nr:hypothetical protein [Sphingomicrobium sp.]